MGCPLAKSSDSCIFFRALLMPSNYQWRKKHHMQLDSMSNWLTPVPTYLAIATMTRRHQILFTHQDESFMLVFVGGFLFDQHYSWVCQSYSIDYWWLPDDGPCWANRNQYGDLNVILSCQTACGHEIQGQMDTKSYHWLPAAGQFWDMTER